MVVNIFPSLVRPTGREPWKMAVILIFLLCLWGITLESDTVLPIRLVNSSSNCSGRVEVFRDGQWGTICDDSWDLKDATVVCRQMGCGVARSATNRTHFGRGAGPTWLDFVRCRGKESALHKCITLSRRTNECSHRDVGVICSGATSEPNTETPIRLVNSSSNCSGRVEVFHGGQWGTVCYDDWNIQEAIVVCRQMGCGKAMSALRSAYFGRGTGPVWLDDVHCSGQESALSQCLASPWGVNNCKTHDDAAVICLGVNGEPGTVTEMRLVNGETNCSGRVEVFHNGQWGTICENKWDIKDSTVVCQRMGCGTAKFPPVGGFFGMGTGPIWLEYVECTGTESDLSQCLAKPWGEVGCYHGEDVSVICSGATLESEPVAWIRLVNGSNNCSGRVEVLHDGQWGTVCDTAWDIREAKVVCRDVGCGEARAAPVGAYFGRGAGPIWRDLHYCYGTEPVFYQCRGRYWAAPDCDHRNDAGVICSGGTLDSDDVFQIRLVNGPNNCSGRVEVFHNGLWGTICDDHWDIKESTVVCKEIGCGEARAVASRALFGNGAGPIWLDNVRCTGKESTLHLCPAWEWGEHDCHRRDNIGVVCTGIPSEANTEAPIRLMNSTTKCSGRVEVFHDGQWGTVCHDNWNIKEAMVVCRQMGCGEARSAPRGAQFGRGTGPIWLDDVNCTGEELALSQCVARPWGSNDCNHFQDASVICARATLQPHTDFGIRLVNGLNNCSGRVEILDNGQWGTICDDNWDIREARIVCQQLRCGEARSAPGGSHFGRGDGFIWLDFLRCTGKESSIRQCPATQWGSMYWRDDICNQGDDAGVICSGGTLESDDAFEIRLVNGPSNCSGRVEVFHNGLWGTICGDGWDLKEATVVCQEMGCGGARAAPVGAHFGRGAGPIWLDNVRCTGNESTLHLCPARPWGEHDCGHREDAAVVCSGVTLETNTSIAIRLVNGSSNCSGRVEVFHDGQWGTVCDDDWDITDARIACQEMGCGEARLAQSGAPFGGGTGPIWLVDVRCTGTESALHQCPASLWENHNCRHGQDVGVVCSGTDLSSSHWSPWISVLCVLLAIVLLAIGGIIWYFRSKRKGRRTYEVPLETMNVINPIDLSVKKRCT